MADERDAFLRQIEEEVRKERLAKLWDKYGVLIIGAVSAIILSVAGWKWYQSYVQGQAARAGAQFVEISELFSDKKNDDAIRGLEQIAKAGPAGYGQLAKLRLAAQSRKAGKTDEAIGHYEALAGDSGADEILRSFAQLQIAALKVDTAPWTETQNRLNDLVKEESHWKYAARELMGLAAFKAGKFDQARQAFTELMAGPDTPATIRQRAQIVMALVSRESGESEKAAAKAPVEKSATKDDKQEAGDAKKQ
ncbi:MAG: tetratricopeptide repeat protein [Pseudomonadota bacterium]